MNNSISTNTDSLLIPSADGQRYELMSPTAMPRAASFLWNKKMMVNVNCRGYVVAQYMQSDASKYAYAPNIEAKTFMQPEQSYYAHHPGRFFYLKDENTGELFSLPYEPVRKKADNFIFSAGTESIEWRVRYGDIESVVTLCIPTDEVAELWRIKVINHGISERKLSLYPSFTIGYMSWMNQAAEYKPHLGGIVASCVTPYQKLEDYPKIKALKDKTFLLHDKEPCAWEASREAFEGEGGIHCPSAIEQLELTKSRSLYETPAAVLQYRLALEANQSEAFHFVFGPAHDENEIHALKNKFLGAKAFETTLNAYQEYQNEGKGLLTASTDDSSLDNLVNTWLPRQIFYHGDVNRLSPDPQTRNYLQDGMGMTYVRPQTARHVFLHALSQQESDGAMPDGILLHPDATLQYINQIPHTDHCLWLPVCLQAYLDETDDYALLDEIVLGTADKKQLSVFERINAAMDFLLVNRDARGLSYIAQGDWCDPMNMVGPKGKGVSGWLSIATIYALRVWADICKQSEANSSASKRHSTAKSYLAAAEALSQDVNTHLWDGKWFARGITDDNVTFGISKDKEGRIFLNPQSWALMANCIDDQQKQNMLEAVEAQLETPYGVTMLAPAFTKMREDVGRVTQKHPGSGENGSVYNHAMVFYIFALYLSGESDRAYRLLRQMIPGPTLDDVLRRGQLPVFIPNYYRGAYYQHPEVAGRSSHLFNTGTVSWYYRCVIEGLYGLKGCREGLKVVPQLPSHWQQAKVTREFRGATFTVHYVLKKELREKGLNDCVLHLDGERLDGNIVRDITRGQKYLLEVFLPNKM